MLNEVKKTKFSGFLSRKNIISVYWISEHRYEY